MPSRVREAGTRRLFRVSPGRLLYRRVLSIGRKQWVRISSATQETIDAVVQVVRRPAGITRVPDIPKNGSLLHDASRFNIAESVKVRVVMPLPAGAQDANNVATKVVFANLEDYTVRRAQHRTTERGEDVDTFVTSIVAARSAPRVGQILWSHFLDRHGKPRRSLLLEQRDECSDPQ